MNKVFIPHDHPCSELGVDIMDRTHDEFIALVNQLGNAGRDEFPVLLETLIEHTETHFETEQQLMQDSGFPATVEHVDEHNRIRGELQMMAKRSRSGALFLPQSYIRDRLPGWFDLHARTMDSALAAHLRDHFFAPSKTPEIHHAR